MKYNIFDTTGVDVILKMSKQRSQNKRFKIKERMKKNRHNKSHGRQRTRLTCNENSKM